VPLPTTSGLISVRPTIKLLPNQPYHWILLGTVAKPGESVLQFLTVDGWIQREVPSPALDAALKTAKGADRRVRLYTDNGIWFEAFDTLAGLRSAEPQNKAWDKEWVKLLTQAGVAPEVIECTQKTCTPPDPGKE
jgi:Domain of Unknown Function (DUF928)